MPDVFTVFLNEDDDVNDGNMSVTCLIPHLLQRNLRVVTCFIVMFFVVLWFVNYSQFPDPATVDCPKRSSSYITDVNAKIVLQFLELTTRYVLLLV